MKIPNLVSNCKHFESLDLDIYQYVLPSIDSRKLKLCGINLGNLMLSSLHHCIIMPWENSMDIWLVNPYEMVVQICIQDGWFDLPYVSKQPTSCSSSSSLTYFENTVSIRI